VCCIENHNVGFAIEVRNETVPGDCARDFAKFSTSKNPGRLLHQAVQSTLYQSTTSTATAKDLTLRGSKCCFTLSWLRWLQHWLQRPSRRCLLPTSPPCTKPIPPASLFLERPGPSLVIQLRISAISMGMVSTTSLSVHHFTRKPLWVSPTAITAGPCLLSSAAQFPSMSSMTLPRLPPEVMD
jgi:hypothetical protein